MKILLTGATGFIGRYVLKFLIEGKQKVNVLVREPSKLLYKEDEHINVYKGDINNFDDVNNSMQSCDTVIHLAAFVSSSTDNADEFYKSNLQGTENLLKAALQNKVKKFVFTSSLSAHSSSNNDVLNEDSLINPDKYFSSYAETKGRAEDLIERYSKQGLSYIIIYPTRVFGIGPLTDANGAAKAISLYLKKRLPVLIDGGNQYACWAFVEDVAKGIISSALSDISNEKFILGGENKTLAEVYALSDRITNKKHFIINIKIKTALSIASIMELAAKLLRKKPLITREWLSFVLVSEKISCLKAMTQLDYQITPFNNALERTIGWIKSLE